MIMRGRGLEMAKKDEEAAVHSKDVIGDNEDAAAGLALTSEAQGVINRQLQLMYGDMLNSPMPDKFAQLLERLARSEKK